MDRFIASIGDKGAGAQVRLRLLRAGRERTVDVTLAARPAEQTHAGDRGAPTRRSCSSTPAAHMALIKGVAFTPDGKQLVSACDDKAIRVWDWQSGKTVRIIRGQVGLGHEGKYLRHGAVARRALAGGRRLAAQGCAGRCGDIRLLRLRHGQAGGAAARATPAWSAAWPSRATASG